MVLITASNLFVLTPNGECEIQLCVGDITHLPHDEKVDVIMVSCFPNDYSTPPHCVVGALKYNLGLSVRDLAYYHKKEDLRQQFSCWISESLPSILPYRQLLCFENGDFSKGQRGRTDTKDKVKGIFRAMMPIFNNQPKSVITPLLATGYQTVPREEMLATILRQAVMWMRQGLPLKLLKIVVYVRGQYHPVTNAGGSQGCLNMFNEMKAQFESEKTRQIREPVVERDIFLVYSEEDAKLAADLQKRLRKTMPQMKFCNERCLKSDEDKWQHDVYVNMVSSNRIVPLLTSSFMSDQKCVDQYNIALCCNRRLRRSVLAPVNMERALALPVYMGLVQWINCRDRSEPQLSRAVDLLCEQIQQGAGPRQFDYDLFISYSHRNGDQANKLLNTFKDLNPELKIFFDFDSIKTGFAWQQTLYRALDESSCVIALLSPEYLASPVCMEELSISVTRHCAQTKSLELIPVEVGPLTSPPLQDYITIVDGVQEYSKLSGFCADVIHWLQTEEKGTAFSEIKEIVNVEEMASKHRKHEFEARFSVKEGSILPNQTDPPPEAGRAAVSLYLSFTASDRKYALFLQLYLRAALMDSCDLDIVMSSDGHSLEEVEKADVIVSLISSTYVKSSKDLEDLHATLCRQRYIKQKLFSAILISDLDPNTPTYIRLLDYSVALTDDLWLQMVPQVKVKGMFPEMTASVLVELEKKGSSLHDDEAVALTVAAMETRQLVLNGADTKAAPILFIPSLPTASHESIVLEAPSEPPDEADEPPQQHAADVTPAAGAAHPAAGDCLNPETGEVGRCGEGDFTEPVTAGGHDPGPEDIGLLGHQATEPAGQNNHAGHSDDGLPAHAQATNHVTLGMNNTRPSVSSKQSRSCHVL